MLQKYGVIEILNAVNKIQNRAMRYYLGVHKFAPIAAMQGDLGWLSVKFRRYRCMTIFLE